MPLYPNIPLVTPMRFHPKENQIIEKKKIKKVGILNCPAPNFYFFVYPQSTDSLPVWFLGTVWILRLSSPRRSGVMMRLGASAALALVAPVVAAGCPLSGALPVFVVLWCSGAGATCSDEEAAAAPSADGLPADMVDISVPSDGDDGDDDVAGVVPAVFC